ncbi:MarR family transcriptional regulator [Microbacterium terricola]|uniref:MarR family transcriptional regulator n=2 Tax=Microbacterium terricola TaxID=344163 RepID=A0ABM8E3D3_9MICO|nr:MarR family transcriptional regulator [Microbacterium terricola]
MLTDSEAALAEAVLIHGPISRSALTRRLGLSAASLTRLTKPFLDYGILIELDDVVDGSVGRPTKPLDMAPDAGRFIGVKLTGDRLYAVATDIRAAVLARAEKRLEDPDPLAVVDAIAEAVDELQVSGLTGLGVSLGGSIRDGMVERAAFLGWTDVDIASVLAQRLGVAVTVENDLIALAEAERWFGLGRGMAGFSVITIGAGVGYALIVHGAVVRSREAGLGLGGHIPLAANGPLCHLGHRGCAEAMLTSGSIATQVTTALQRQVTYREALDLARAGDPAAAAVIDAAADALGRFIALAANLTMQHSVVLAGEGVELYSVAADRVSAAIAADRDPLADPLEVHVDTSGFLAWARGAAAVAIQAAISRLEIARV